MNDMSNMKNQFHNMQFDTLNPVISCESIKRIEQKYNFVLPEEYREFISSVGNGGSCSTSEYDSDIKLIEFGENLSLEHVKDDFPLQDSWSITDANDIDDFLETENKGYLRIASCNSCCDEEWLLVVTGAYRGEVWLMDDYGFLRLPDVNFTEWLNLYFSNQLSAKIEKLAEEERAKSNSYHS